MLQVSKKKFADMKDLCNFGIIPSIYHGFYLSLSCASDVCDVVYGYDKEDKDWFCFDWYKS